MRAAGLEIIPFVDIGIECTLRQLLEHGYFHADPHPGNLLATKEGNLCYLDFGMMSEAPQSARYAIIAHVVHLVNRDYPAMCRDYYTLDFISRDVDTAPIAPALAAFFDDVLDASVTQLNFKAIIDGLGNVLFEYPFQVPAYYALILRSLTVLEGLAIAANPDYQVIAQAYPYMASRLLTDPSPELRTSLEDLLFRDGSFRWQRLDNLLTEGAKSTAFDEAQLWLLLDYLVSDQATPLRGLVSRELVRLVDGFAATAAHDNVAQVSAEAAGVLVPLQPRDRANSERVHALGRWLAAHAPNPADESFEETVQKAQAVAGPDAAAELLARLQGLLQQPGSAELAGELGKGLTEKALARALKGALNLQSGAGAPAGAPAALPRGLLGLGGGPGSATEA